jgi:hypothetical protein
VATEVTPVTDQGEGELPMRPLLLVFIAAMAVTTGDAQARMVATRAQCISACGQATIDACGWITKRGKFNRCRVKLLNQCRKWGPSVMCPAPTTTQPPVVTTPTSTLPLVPTTTSPTTLPYIPPTTTTLPPPIPFVAMSVDAVELVYCSGYPAQKVWVTVCAGGGAYGLNLNPASFLFTQGGVSSLISTCHYDFRHTTACSAAAYVSSPSCHSCSLVYDRPYTGNPRDLYYLDYALDSLKYEIDVAF